MRVQLFFCCEKHKQELPQIDGKERSKRKIKKSKKDSSNKTKQPKWCEICLLQLFLLRHRRGKPIFWMRVCKCVRLCLTKAISNIGPEIECERECGVEEGELKNNTKKTLFFSSRPPRKIADLRGRSSRSFCCHVQQHLVHLASFGDCF